MLCKDTAGNAVLSLPFRLQEPFWLLYYGATASSLPCRCSCLVAVTSLHTHSALQYTHHSIAGMCMSAFFCQALVSHRSRHDTSATHGLLCKLVSIQSICLSCAQATCHTNNYQLMTAATNRVQYPAPSLELTMARQARTAWVAALRLPCVCSAIDSADKAMVQHVAQVAVDVMN